MAVRAQGLPRPAAAVSPWLAGVDLSGHRVVRAAPGNRVVYPQLAALEDGDAIVGVTLGAAAVGALASLQDEGEITEPSWSWTPGPVFCGDGGVLTQVPPDGPWTRQVGTAISPTCLLVQLSPTYLRRL